MQSIDAAAAQMQQCARALRELAGVPSQASREASSSILKLIDRQFDAQTDPYGRPWKALKPSTVKAKGHSTIGFRTGELRSGIKVAPMSGAGVAFELDAPYAAYFQSRRPILPNRGVPKAWAGAIADAMENATKRWAATVPAAAPSGSLVERQVFLDHAAE